MGGVPVVLEPAPVPGPPRAVPVEVTDAEVAVRVPVNRPPEEGVLALPAFGNELLVLEQTVEDVCVQDGFVLEDFPKLGAADHAFLLLVGEEEIDLFLIDVEIFSTTFDPDDSFAPVLLDFPVVVRKRWVSGEIDSMCINRCVHGIPPQLIAVRCLVSNLRRIVSYRSYLSNPVGIGDLGDLF